MSRTVNVVRMQLVNRETYLWVPLIVLGGSFAITLAVYFLLNRAGVDTAMFGGGAQAPLWYFLYVGVQALTLTFPFSQAMSVTRREFYLGTLLTAVLASLVLAAVFVVGGFVEEATDGWGLNGYFFALPWIWDRGWWVAGVLYFAVAMVFFIIGFWTATIYKRFSSIGLTIVLVAIGLVLVGVLWLVGHLQAWATVWEWFVAQGPLGLSLWGLLFIAVLAATAFPLFRRLTP
ncbi:hypothetical protein [Microbacterium sp. P05]|uniref:hypothetical protein n=1 Tax=Microbacterium sp. P05 TaxID=3366948 RepID=UPI00374675CD